MAAFKDLKSAGVVVFANSRTDWNKLPKGAKNAKKDAGKTIPMAFVTSADGRETIDSITYDELSNDTRKAARELKKLLKERAEEVELAELETKRIAEAAVLAEEQAWTNKDGKTITAAVKSATLSSVVFLIKKKKVTYPMADLSAQSQKQIKTLLRKAE